ncbi:MAG TPA: tRNA lysidine(34) synthetase TilS [Anaerolineae bacterium]
MADLKVQVERFIQAGPLLSPGAAIVVGVSGGPDSVCLLHLLWRLAPAWGWRLQVAHLNHGLRGAEADEDARFVAALAAELGIPFTGGCVDVPGLAASNGLSVEEAARLARYRFLAQVAAAVPAGAVAVGHNADDQAETVLMHFLRGSGPAGLRGMLPGTELAGEAGARPALALVRPLLATPRAAIADYCAEQGLAVRQDCSNDDPAFRRNRLRHELLPILETYNPRIRETLARAAALMAGDYEVLEAAVGAAWDEVVVKGGDGAVYLHRDRWRSLLPGLQRATLRRAVQELGHTLRNVGWEHVEAAAELGRAGHTGQAATLPGGLALEIGYDVLRVAPAGRPWPAAHFPQVAAALALAPGVTALGGGWRVSLERLPVTALPADYAVGPDIWTAWLDAEVAGDDLVLRPRQAGDRFQPLGLAGRHASLHEFMIDARVPAAARAGWPVLAGAAGILWLCGLRLAEPAVVRPATREVWLVRLSRVGA